MLRLDEWLFIAALLTCGLAPLLFVVYRIDRHLQTTAPHPEVGIRTFIWACCLIECLYSLLLLTLMTSFGQIRIGSAEQFLMTAVIVSGVAIGWPFIMFFLWSMTESFRMPSMLLEYIAFPILAGVVAAVLVERRTRRAP